RLAHHAALLGGRLLVRDADAVGDLRRAAGRVRARLSRQPPSAATDPRPRRHALRLAPAKSAAPAYYHGGAMTPLLFLALACGLPDRGIYRDLDANVTMQMPPG